MKICKKCNHKFADSAVFCPDCGEKLIVYEQTDSDRSYMAHTEINKAKTDRTEMGGNLVSQIKSKSMEWDNNENIFMRWLPSIISVLALIIAWEWSSLLGLAIAVCGALYGWFSKNQLNQIIATVVGVITILLCIVYGF